MHWNEGEIALSAEELVNWLSKHTSDCKVQLVRKAKNAAGKLQVIKRLRSGTVKWRNETRDMIKILGNKAG